MFDIVRKTLFTLWFWTGTVLATILTGIVVVCSVPCRELSKRQTHDRITFHIEYIMARFIYYWMTIPRIWSYTILYESEEAREAMQNNKGAFILASNHSSIIDTLFMAMLPFQKTYTYNGKWSKVPIFGKMCVEAGYVDTHPPGNNREKVVETVIKRIESGYSVMIYPEGTRTHDPTKIMEKIKTGAFRMAQGSKRPVLPIAFLGMYRGMGRWGIIDSAKMACVICAPINVPKVAKETSDPETVIYDVEGEKQAVIDASERWRKTLNVHLQKNSLGKRAKVSSQQSSIPHHDDAIEYVTDDEVWE